jgi:thiamine pyrophosphate-dependent acetolactate synthase large subunit-like protein
LATRRKLTKARTSPNTFPSTWDYVSITESLGGRSLRVRTRAALSESLRSRGVFLIDAILSPTDLSPTWTRIADGIRSRLKRAGKREG